MPIYPRELFLTDKAESIEALTAIEKRSSEKEWWELVVDISNQEDSYLVSNARHQTRHWANLTTIIKFIRENCPKYVEARWHNGQAPLHLCFGLSDEEVDVKVGDLPEKTQ